MGGLPISALLPLSGKDKEGAGKREGEQHRVRGMGAY